MAKETKRSKSFVKVTRNTEEIYQEISERLASAEESRVLQLEKAKDGYDRYNNIKGSKNTPWPNASNVSVPITTISLDTKLPRWSQALIERDPICRVISSDRDSQEAAKKQEYFIKWANKHWFEASMFWLRVFKSAGLYPLAVVKLYWEKKKVWEYYEDDKDLDKTKKEKKKDKKYIEKHEEVVNQAKAKLIPFENMLLPPNYPNIKEAPWTGEYIDLTITEFKELGIAREWDKTLVEQIVKHSEGKDGASGEAIDDNKNARLNSEGYDDDTHKKKGNSVIRIIEFFGDVNVDGKGDAENVNIVLYTPLKKILQIEENPYWHKEKPYIDFKIELTDEIFGKSIPEKLRHMQDQADADFNMFNDNMKLSSQKMFRKSSAVKPSDIKFKPGGYVTAKRKEDIEVFNVGNASAQPLQTLDIVLDFAKRISGDSDYSQGQPGNTKRTATEVLTVVKQGNMRYRLQSFLLANSMQRFYEMFIKLCKQYVPQSGVEVKIFGEDDEVVFEEKVTPKDLEKDFELEVTPNYEIFSLEANLDLKIKTMELVQNSGVKADVQPLLNEILEMLGVRNIDSILVDNPYNDKVQTKTALLENASMGQIETPVNEFDNHNIHMEIHGQTLEQIKQSLSQIPPVEAQNPQVANVVKSAQALEAHMKEHENVAQKGNR